MAVYKRKFKNGKGFSWRAVVRVKGHPAVCDSFERKEEAENWADNTKREIKLILLPFKGHLKHRQIE